MDGKTGGEARERISRLWPVGRGRDDWIRPPPSQQIWNRPNEQSAVDLKLTCERSINETHNLTITLFQPRLAPLSIVGIWLEYDLPSNVSMQTLV